MYNTSNHSISTHKRANKRILKLCASLTQMTERARAVRENAQLKGKNYKWAKLETYRCLQTLLLLLKFWWSATKESFVKNQCAALYKIGHILKRKIVDQGWWKIRFGSELTNSCCFAMATERWCQDRIVAFKYEITLLDWLKSFYT